jgi:hypothetical protein
LTHYHQDLLLEDRCVFPRIFQVIDLTLVISRCIEQQVL